MTSEGHKKHAAIERPDLGQFGRYELGILGAPCSVIHSLVEQCAEQLSSMKLTYVDADHQESNPSKYLNLTDKIKFHRWDYDRPLNSFDRKILLSESDVLLVNTNHFPARRQIVICHEKKRESLQRKLDRLTDVGLILLAPEVEQPYPFLENVIQKYKPEVLQLDDAEAIGQWIKADYHSHLPKVKGLVLAGGKSQRMGKNKATLAYHGVSQLEYAFQAMNSLGIETFVSCRRDVDDYPEQFPRVYDTFDGLGPFGAILSAFRQDPNAAWLVTAIDQPLLSSKELNFLLSQRNASKMATCFHNPETGFPEPLITLWEPKSYQRLLSFLALGYSCPRKVLINSEIYEIHVEDTTFMKNANTPEERSIIQKLIQET